MHGLLFAAIVFKMAEPEGSDSAVAASGSKLTFRPKCVECRKVLTEEEKIVHGKLCANHFANFENLYKADETGSSYTTFRNNVLGKMCLAVIAFQFAINSTVETLFQPLITQSFGWQSQDIAYMMSFMSLLGFAVTSFFSGLARNGAITAQQQNKIGQACFLVAIALFVIPPLSKFRLVAAYFFSFFGKIIFSGPMHVIFGQIMTSDHITSIQLSILGAQIAFGTATGCFTAPYLLPYAGSWFFCVALVPAILGIVFMMHILSTYDPDGRVAATKKKKEHRAAIRERFRVGVKAAMWGIATKRGP